MARKLKKTRKRRKTTARTVTKRPGTTRPPAGKQRVHRFGELYIPPEANVRDSSCIEGDDVNESMDVWWGWEE